MENNKKKAGADAQKMEEKKYTESEFNAACGQLYQKLMKEIQMRDMTNMFRRLDYLFKVVENRSCFSSDFVGDCVEEIEVALTPVESESEKDNQPENTDNE